MKRWAGGEHVQEQAGESGTAVKGSRVALQNQVEVCSITGNRKEPLSPPSSLLPGGPQDPLPKGWNANPNTKRAW